ncbi:undecaprenyldiphospho-muramoylpentapeptide beta-N-acetylglucosaminyltransferase [Corynebacterium lubricantis]|uniref:undecaprenyldiphospho-muramoylpentapeptide beta-N-acetylglucosaminyltransferase n=1 Tax=Corynebacterium lubricantis TaxID=541095 RepID=UPI000363DAFE|nr:undecaprenyldiphospho-muramoylpentapeptide beta-N-acetylglucosaminyltransferase [Corynebacterium lubricantis]
MARDNSASTTVVLAGGGTAGHIEPALAVGEVLRDNYGANVIALGTPKGLETSIVPARGFTLELIDPVPVPRKQPLKLLALPFKVIKSVGQARKAMKNAGADVVFGTGGYVSASAYMAAASLRLPIFVLESNALAGVANKLGVRLGGTGFNAVANSGMKGEVVGIPVRQSVGADDDGEKARRGYATWNLDPEKKTILVTGGSQGAVSLNTAIEESIEQLTSAGYQVLHAYGRKNDAPEPHENYVAVPYIDDMSAALAVADLVICRSGAMTVAENAAAGVPAIYVPLPHGNGEQGLNSKHLVEAGAARMIDDAALTADVLVENVVEILSDEQTYNKMRVALADSGAGNVADTLARRVMDAAQSK